MRIAIFTDTFIPQTNGVVSSILMLSKGLADRGHKVFIYAPRFEENPRLYHKNIYVRRNFSIPAYFYEDFKFSFPFYPKLLLEIKKNKIDLIHFHTPIMLGFQAITLARFLNLPLVGTFHTFIADPHYLKHVKINNSMMQKASWNYCNFYYNFCDMVTCPSESAKEEFLAHGCKRPIKVLSNGIDLEEFDNSNAKQQKKKLNPNGKLLLFVGRIAHEKNVVQLLKIFEIVNKKSPSTKLVLVGGGPQLNEIKHRVKEMGLKNKVIITGSISHSKLIKSGIFGASDIFVSASTTETQGITVLEAQANGLVCVGADARGVSELIIDGESGYLVNPNHKAKFANKILKLLNDKTLYQKMKKQSKIEVKKHDINIVLDRWVHYYDMLIKHHKKKKDASLIGKIIKK